MKYYGRLIWLFFRTSVQEEAAFRLNFAINILTTILNLGSGILGLLILFSQVETVQGWTFPQTLTLLAVYLFVLALRDLVIGPSMNALGGIDGEVWTGRFDYTLLKPAPLQFLVSVRKWRIWAVVDLLLSLIILAIALAHLQQTVTWLQAGLFVFSMLLALLILYAILLILASLSFWAQGVPLDFVFNSFIQLGRYPVGIYPEWLRLLLTWIVPVGFMTTIPIQLLTEDLSPGVLLSGTLLALFLFWLASHFFRASLHRYASASS
jgi:ABC-2 type transport system permease protein